MSKQFAVRLILGFLLMSSVALSGQRPRKPEQLEAQLRKAPATVNSLRNPYAGQLDEAILAGKKLFRRHCAGCHGTDAQGQDKAPDLHSGFIQDASPGTLFWFLKNGNLKEGMPSWSRLPDEQIWQLVTFLQTLRQ